MVGVVRVGVGRLTVWASAVVVAVVAVAVVTGVGLWSAGCLGGDGWVSG